MPKIILFLLLLFSFVLFISFNWFAECRPLTKFIRNHGRMELSKAWTWIWRYGRCRPTIWTLFTFSKLMSARIAPRELSSDSYERCLTFFFSLPVLSTMSPEFMNDELKQWKKYWNYKEFGKRFLFLRFKTHRERDK